MGILNSWEKWSQRQWNKWGRKLQPKYDQIKSLKLPPELSEAFDKLWEAVTPDVQKSIWVVVETMYKKFGTDRAKESLKVIIDYLSKVFGLKNK